MITVAIPLGGSKAHGEIICGGKNKRKKKKEENTEEKEKKKKQEEEAVEYIVDEKQFAMFFLSKSAPELLLISVIILTLTGKVTGHELIPGPDVKKVSVKEDSDVILPCFPKTMKNIEQDLFDWRKIGQPDAKEVFMYDGGDHYNNGRSGQDEKFKGRVSHFPDQLKNGNASIIIRNTTVTDSGNYTCDFPRLQPRQTFFIELVVVVLYFGDRT